MTLYIVPLRNEHTGEIRHVEVETTIQSSAKARDRLAGQLGCE